MRRAKPIDVDETPGGDSFLDIVANIVGILVLLVVVVGVRAGRQIAIPQVVAAEDPQDEIEELQRQAKQLKIQRVQDQRDTLALREKLQATALEQELKERERSELTLYATKLRSELDEARAELDADDQRSLETSNAIAQAQLKLDRLAREQVSIASTEPEPDLATVTVAPTPIVDGQADQTVSFRLQEGRLVYVPVNELTRELSSRVRPPTINDPSRPAKTRERVGPIEGFGAEAEILWAVRSSNGQIGLRSDLSQMYITEVAPLRGETPAAAFGPGGYVASRIDLLDPAEYVVQLFVYADSFETAPEVGALFRERGFRVALSLKNDGSRLGFSSTGHKAVTQ